jgi:transposase
LKRAFALAEGVDTFATSTIAAKRRTLERSLADILAAPTACELVTFR